jgi:hypothetical protein
MTGCPAENAAHLPHLANPQNALGSPYKRTPAQRVETFPISSTCLCIRDPGVAFCLQLSPPF